jgi:hypothetical protein
MIGFAGQAAAQGDAKSYPKSANPYRRAILCRRRNRRHRSPHRSEVTVIDNTQDGR